MQDKKVRILDLDGSITAQKALASRYDPEITDLLDLGPKARFWMSRKTRSQVKERIKGSFPGGVTLLGSGDFHHISDILIENLARPVTVIDFDYHPDWDILLPFLHCGSWVAKALKRKDVLKVIEFGPSSDDLSDIWIQTCDIDALKDDRLEIYPYSHSQTTVFFKRIPENISIEASNGPISGKIRWNELKDKNVPEFLRHVLNRLPCGDVYVSIDKDCLVHDYSLTNWGQGRFELDELMVMLRIIRENARIIGADICGDYSKPVMSGLMKNIVASLNRPKHIKAETLPPAAVTKINEETNLKILDILAS